MLINSWSFSYIVLSFFALFIVIALFICFFLWHKDLKQLGSSIHYYTLEKKIYLINTFFQVLFYLRLFLIPYWFLLLNSLIPSIPGAMCLVGVHFAAWPYSIGATVFKIVMPMIYGLWLLLHFFDQKVIGQVLLKWKLWLVPPFLILTMSEIFFDLKVLTTIHPRVVNCCTSIFDTTQSVIGQISTQQTLPWVWIIICSLIIMFFSNILMQKSNMIKGYLLLINICLLLVALISVTMFLHQDGCRLFLGTLYHHCIFCLLAQRPLILLASVIFFIGQCYNLVLLFIVGIFMQTNTFMQFKIIWQKQLKISLYITMIGVMIYVVNFIFAFKN